MEAKSVLKIHPIEIAFSIVYNNNAYWNVRPNNLLFSY